MQALRILVVVMGVMIVIGTVIVAATIAKRAGVGTAERVDAPALTEFGDVSVSLPPGSTLVGELLHHGHLVLKTRSETGEMRYVVVDVLTGRTRGTIQAVQGP